MIAGGGTGGHVYPALAVASEVLFQNKDAEILFVGTTHGLEATLVPKAKFDFHPIRAQGLPRRFSWGLVKAVNENLHGLVQARRILRRFKPDVVLGMGGYVSGAVVFDAWRLGIPTVIHEQNAFPGLANRWLSRIVDRVLVNSADGVPYFAKVKNPVEVVGNPIRSQILRIQREDALQKLELNPKKRTLLIFGGSRGAVSLNRAVIEALKDLRALAPSLQVIFVTGTEHYDEAANAFFGMRLDVRVVPYLDEMPLALAVADLAVTRAGATTLAELTARGVPAIVVPFPYATANHQEHNARSLVEAGGARMILDAELSGERLANTIRELLKTPGLLEQMSEAQRAMGIPDAAEKIAEVLARTAHRSLL